MSVTVLSRAASGRLTTLENARMDLGGTLGSSSDLQMQRFIDQASSQAASYCRRVFGRETVRERINLCGYRTDDGGILLDRGPIVRILGGMVDGATYAPEAFEVVGGREVFLTLAGERVCWRGSRLTIDYEAGWLLPGEEREVNGVATLAEDLPADIERAVIQLVGVAASMSGRDITVKSEQTDGVGQTDFYVQGANASLPHPEAESILSQYRRMLFA
ncbi:hypothetical protein [Methylobacterium sp. CM6247]